MKRANYLPVPHVFNLSMACRALNDAFGWGSVFLVGSSLERRDYRDVDVRCIIDDADFDRLFPAGGNQHDALWSLMCASISLYLERHTGLPIDFQIQRRTDANKEYSGRRHPLGVFHDPKPVSSTSDE